MTSADEMRAALTAALTGVPELDPEFVADRILPTVRGIVAAELRAAADDLWRKKEELSGDLAGHVAFCSLWLRDRADTLDPTS